MSGYARTAGLLVKQVTIGGRRYTLRAPSIAKLIGEMETDVISHHGNPLLAAAEAVEGLSPGLSPEVRRRLETRIWQAAEAASVRANTVTTEEMNDFEQSLRGIAFKFWKCIEQDHGNEVRSAEDALELLAELVEEQGPAGLEETAVKTSQVTGEEDAKNSSGPSRKARAGRGGRSRRSPAGRPSSSILPSDTSTPPTRSEI